MSPSGPQKLRNTLFWSIFRVMAVTILVTIIGFAVSLFLSIAGVLLAALLRGGGLNMSIAYRNIALPIALGVLVITLLATLVIELRGFRSRSTAGRE